jgi:phage terminase small subunit
MQKLTERQKRFIKFYNGNAAEAAVQAGYSKGIAKTVGHKNMCKPWIYEAIQQRMNKIDGPIIATRADRQKFWTEVMLDKTKDMNDRLKASELLGRSEADFTEKHLVAVDDELLEALNKSNPDRLRDLLCQLN